MKWIKIWTEETIRGTTISELDISDRGIWFTLLALAGDSPDEGFVYLRQGVGYDNDTLAKIINCDKDDIVKTFRKLIDCEKITVDSDGVVAIRNWEIYQDDYSRYQKSKSYLKVNTKRSKSSLKKITSKDIDIDKDKDTTMSPAVVPEPKAIDKAKGILEHFNTICHKKYAMTDKRKTVIFNCLKAGRSVEDINTAITNFSKDDWPDRHKFTDLVYAIGQQHGKADNFDKWFNYVPVNKIPEPPRVDTKLRKKSLCCNWSISKADGKYICNKCKNEAKGFID